MMEDSQVPKDLERRVSLLGCCYLFSDGPSPVPSPFLPMPVGSSPLTPHICPERKGSMPACRCWSACRYDHFPARSLSRSRHAIAALLLPHIYSDPQAPQLDC